jgi:RNA polymerase sigma-70 factor (ECF subfamily)
MDVDLEACRRGDKSAWDAFVDRYARVIWAAVTRVHRGRGPGGDPADVVQDVFVRIVRDDFRLLRTFDPSRASLTTWLTVVARSVAIDHLRRRRIEAAPLEGHDVAGEAPPPPAAPAVPLHLLTDRQRVVLRMLFDEERSVADTARLLEVDEQTVRSTKHKALSRLREHMAETAENPDSEGRDPRG